MIITGKMVEQERLSVKYVQCWRVTKYTRVMDSHMCETNLLLLCIRVCTREHLEAHHGFMYAYMYECVTKCVCIKYSSICSSENVCSSSESVDVG
jgi:hypothetical protein